MPSLLPQQIPPITVPMLDKSGQMNVNWWLFLYNLAEQSLGNQNNTASPMAVQLLTDTDIDAETADPLPLFKRVSNLEGEQTDPEQYASILLAQMALQMGISPLDQDPPHQAQPVQGVSVGASPFIYTAPFDGILTVTGGTVSDISLNRGAGLLTTGLTVGIVPVRRLDQVQVTWSGLPVMSFYPN